MQKAYNVPSIIRCSDSLGNASYRETVPEDVSTWIVDWRRQGHGDLYPGDTLVAEVEVDPSFQVSEYDVAWQIFGKEMGSGSVARVVIQSKHVGDQFELRFQLTTKRDWHRSFGFDDALVLIYRVLPPVV